MLSIFFLSSMYFSVSIQVNSCEIIKKFNTSILEEYAWLINLALSVLVFLEIPSAIFAEILNVTLLI